MSLLRAIPLLRENIRALLAARKDSESALARALGMDKSWINKFLNGRRNIKMEHLDALSAFFGLPSYQLFQPGIGALTERRSGMDRRTGRDRRVGHAHRQMLSVARVVEAVGRKGWSPTTTARLRDLTMEYERRIQDVLEEDTAQPSMQERHVQSPQGHTRKEASARNRLPKRKPSDRHGSIHPREAHVDADRPVSDSDAARIARAFAEMRDAVAAPDPENASRPADQAGRRAPRARRP